MLAHADDVIYPHGERENYWPNLFEPFARVAALELVPERDY